MATNIIDKVARLFTDSTEQVVQMLFDSRVEDLIFKSLEDLVGAERKLVLAEIGRNWDFFYGNQRGYFKQYLGETDEEFRDKAKPTFNYTRLVIDEYVKGVMGQGVTLKTSEEAAQKWWDESILPTMNLTRFLKTTQRISELSYDCLIIPRWDEVRKRVYFEEVRGEYVKYFPDPNNPRRLGAIAIVYLYDSGLGTPDASSLLKRIELWSRERIKIEEFSPKLSRRKIVFDDENPYKDFNGESVIPISIFQPDEDDNTFYGYGNAGDISEINTYYNNVWMDLLRIVTFQSFSVLYIKSATKIDIQIAPTRFLKTNDPDAEVDYVTPDAKIEEVRKVREDFKNELLDLSKIPTEVLSGSKKDLPASGFSLQVKRMPIESLWKEKKEIYADPISSLMSNGIIVQNTHGKTVATKDPSAQVIYSEVPLPMEAQSQQMQDAFDLEHGVTSPVGLYMRKHDVSREEAEEAILKNLEETKKIREALGLTLEGDPTQTDFLQKLNVFTPPPQPPVGDEEE